MVKILLYLYCSLVLKCVEIIPTKSGGRNFCLRVISAGISIAKKNIRGIGEDTRHERNFCRFQEFPLHTDI